MIPDREPRAPATAFAVFAFLWALSGLLDLAPFDAWLRSPFHALFATASLAVLVRPTWLWAFAAMNVLRVATFVVDSPDTANHQVLYAAAALAILAAGIAVGVPAARRVGAAEAKRVGAAEAKRTGRWLRLDPASWLDAFAPTLRSLLLVLYVFAVLHKLNHDYLDPAYSCAVNTYLGVAPVALAQAVGDSVPMRRMLIVASLCVEAAIPLLIVVRRTRRLGIALGVVFHSFLGIRFYAFSTGLFALYSLFLAPAIFAALARTAAELRRRAGALGFLVSGWTPRALALLLVTGFAVAGYGAAHPGRQLAGGMFPIFAGLWVAAVAGAAAGLLSLPGSRTLWREPGPGRAWPTGWMLVFPLLVCANGLSPYLGLRTVPTFSMFSNLRTEGKITNHLFMPARALRVSSVQDDLVTVLSAEDPELLRFARRPRRTYYDLKRRIQRMALERGKTDIAIRFRRGERTVVLRAAERDAELMAPISWPTRKFLRFRPVPIDLRRECSW